MHYSVWVGFHRRCGAAVWRVIMEGLFGIETEYAVAGMTTRGPVRRDEFIERIVALARQRLVHLPDLSSSAGVFLQNGSRFMIDQGLPEISTPECTHPTDVVRYVQAGHRILSGIAAAIEAESPPGTEIMCFRNNVDYGGTQSTWGSHESYSHTTSSETIREQIIPHLVTRIPLIGSGGFHPLVRGLSFSLAPRVAHLQHVAAGSSTHDRPIFHEKDEPLGRGYSRLHVICGESNCSETSTFLRVGCTALVVRMIEAGLKPGSAVQLADPLAAIHSVAADVTCHQPLPMAVGGSKTSVSIQRHYLEMAAAHLDILPSWSREVVTLWRAILDKLESDDAPAAVAQILDWGIKYAVYTRHARRLGICWDKLHLMNEVVEKISYPLFARDDSGTTMSLKAAIASKRKMPAQVQALEPMLIGNGLGWQDLRKLMFHRQSFLELDTRFGQLNSPRGVFEALNRTNALQHQLIADGDIESAMSEPPASGRAHIRGEVIRRLAGTTRSRADWSRIINLDEKKLLDLSDPFAAEEVWRAACTSDLCDSRYSYSFEELFERRRESGPPSPWARRQSALEFYLSGDFAVAEELLRGVLADQFEVPSTHTHLARVLMMVNREDVAREQVALAWAARNQGPAYVTGRTLFFQCLFAIFDGNAISGLVAQLKQVLSAGDAHMDWSIQPMLDHVRPRLSRVDWRFLNALARTLSNSSNLPRLSQVPEWRNVPAREGEAA